MALADPMNDVFDRSQRNWTDTAVVPEILRQTQLPLPSLTAPNRAGAGKPGRFATPRGTAEYWTEKMARQDLGREDNLDTARFNRALWEGLMGADLPYPTVRHGRDPSKNRDALLKAAVAGIGGR